jgi:hypothetical protein
MEPDPEWAGHAAAGTQNFVVETLPFLVQLGAT